MYRRFVVGFAVAGVVSLGFSYACGGGSSSPSSPTPTPTNGTLTIKGATSETGVFSIRPGPTEANTPVAGSPTSVKVKTYKVYLAANADCTNPVLVQDKGGADHQEMTGRPTMFSASVAAGTYNCLILKVSDIVKFTPDATAQSASNGVCQAGREVTFDILKVETQATEIWYDVETNATISGAGSYANPVAQDVFLFFSTNESATRAANGRIDNHQLQGLANPVVIRTSQVTNGAFIFDFSNISVVSYDDNSPKYCWLEEVDTRFIMQ